MVNRQIRLAARPVGYPNEGDLRLVETPAPEPREGQVLVKTLWLSLDPYMRGRMNTMSIGDVMPGGTVGRIVTSKRSNLAEGDIVVGSYGWQEYAVSDGRDVREIDPKLAPASTALGLLGMPGMTAYFGLLEIGHPKPGDTVVVSAASGAVGQVVGQIARIMDCRVVGIAGSEAKIRYIVDELGFDAGINYKTQDVMSALPSACPDGVDVYFDNVGGAVADAVLAHLASRARVVICGQISQYNLKKPELGPRILGAFLMHQARAEGFTSAQFANHYDEGRRRLARWLNEGKLKYREDVVRGLENAPRAFIGLFKGENFGKLVVKVADE